MACSRKGGSSSSSGRRAGVVLSSAAHWWRRGDARSAAPRSLAQRASLRHLTREGFDPRQRVRVCWFGVCVGVRAACRKGKNARSCRLSSLIIITTTTHRRHRAGGRNTRRDLVLSARSVQTVCIAHTKGAPLSKRGLRLNQRTPNTRNGRQQSLN